VFVVARAVSRLGKERLERCMAAREELRFGGLSRHCRWDRLPSHSVVLCDSFVHPIVERGVRPHRGQKQREAFRTFPKIGRSSELVRLRSVAGGRSPPIRYCVEHAKQHPADNGRFSSARASRYVRPPSKTDASLVGHNYLWYSTIVFPDDGPEQ